jgi:hypothetical protein
LLLAIAVAVLDLVTLLVLEIAGRPVLGKACGMTEIVPMFSCGRGWIAHSIEIVMNLPFLFFYALVFTVFPSHSLLTRPFMQMLYIFDVIFVLGAPPIS